MAEAPAPLNTIRAVAKGLSGNLQRVEQGGPGNDGRAVLVVVHDGDGKFFLQAFFDLETVGRLDVFEVDAPERGLQRLSRFV